MLPRAILSKIHVAKSQLAMEDDAYRAMLMSVAGVKSSKDLSLAQAEKVLAHLQRSGFKPLAPKSRSHAPADERAALVRKLFAQLKAAGRDWSYLERAADGGISMVRRICGVDAVSFCDVSMLKKLVAALTYDARRHGKR